MLKFISQDLSFFFKIDKLFKFYVYLILKNIIFWFN